MDSATITNRIAGPPPRTIWTKRRRAAISARFKGVPKSLEHARKISESQRGKKISEEQKDVMSENQRRLWADPEYRSKQMAAYKNAKRIKPVWNKGKTMSTAARAANSRGQRLSPKAIGARLAKTKRATQVNRRLWQDPNWRANQILKRKAYWSDPVNREAQSKRLKGNAHGKGFKRPKHLKERQSKIIAAKWADPVWRTMMLERQAQGRKK